MFRLTLGDIQFENWTIQGDWYQGGNGRDVTHLRFVNCSFSLIASDAFCSKALRKLKRLSFHNIDSIKFISGWAEGLPLIYINIENAMVEDLQYDVLHVPSLKMLIMFSSFGNYNIMNIFESSGQTLSHLNITNAPSIRTISGMHLFRLNGIRHLVLNSCGIEIIAENTFLKTQLLTSLDLGGNHLKTLPATALDTLLHSRYLLSINLMNNEWECYCDLLTARDHLTTYDFAFPSFPKNCPFTEMTKPNGTYIHDEKLCLDSENVTITKYKSCEMEIGFDTIFIGYPKFIIKADISLSNLLIKSPTEQNNNYYYFTPNHGDFPKLTHKSEKCSDFTSVPCWIFKNQTQSLPLKMFHGQKPRTFYFVDSGARTGIWPYNSVSICKGCDEITKVWLRLSSILWASIISVIVGMICISIGMTLGFLLLRLCPKLLRGSKRVIFLQNNTADRKYSSTIFVMPSDWKCPGRQNERFLLVFFFVPSLIVRYNILFSKLL